MDLIKALQQLITDFGTTHKNDSIEQMRAHIKSELDKVPTKGASTAIKKRICDKIIGMKTKEKILLELSEQMFGMQGMGV